MRSPARPMSVLLSLVVTGFMVVALAACGIDSGKSGSGAEDAKSAAPNLSDVTPLTNVRDWKGPVTAVPADDGLDPIAEDPAQKLPVTLTDHQGTKVTVKDTSRTLALDLNGTLARTIFELGLGDQLVGRDISTQFDEAKKLPTVTQGGHDLSAEGILALDPTLIITDTSLGPWDVVLQMRDAGIPVVVVDSDRSLRNVGSLTEEIADAMGVPDQGKKLAQRTESEIKDVQAKIAKVAPAADRDRLRTVFLYVRGNAGVYYMFGEDSGADALIESLGLYDVAGEINWKGMKPVTDEGLIAAQPELILMMSKGIESAGGVEGLMERLPALEQTPAGQNRRIVDMNDSEILGYGPLTPQVLNALAVAIYAPESIK